MENKIYGLIQHPDRPALDADYKTEVTTGEYSVVFEHRAWGKSTNLFCYFTDLATGEKYRLSVFHRQNYCPYDDGISFREAEIGSQYKIKIGESKNGLPKFISAVILPT